MVMYWPDQKVAVRIVDDPSGRNMPELPDDWQVLETTVAQQQSLSGMREFMDSVARALGQEPPEKTPEWLEGNARLHRELFGAAARP